MPRERKANIANNPVFNSRSQVFRGHALCRGEAAAAWRALAS